MTELEALDRFNAMAGTFQPIDLPPGDDAILLWTAAASLSGMLPDCRTDEDLQDAVRHAVSLVEMGVLTTEQRAVESERIERELMSWGEAIDRLPGMADPGMN